MTSNTRHSRTAAAFVAAVLLSCASTTPDTRPLSPPAAPPASPAVVWKHDWARGAVFYQVFVRSFFDANGDGVGDLQGLTSKLDYLSDLGVEGLWLMPVFKSPSYHGYDVVDYENVNPAYGTNADFERFLQEAHRRGIRVIVDYVINHSGAQHPWFVESSSSPSSPKRDWYVWRADDPGWTQPWGGPHHTWHELNGAYFYGIFWGGMPDLNFRTPAVRQEMTRVADLWLSRGLDGFRLDAARHLIETGPDQGQCDSAETHAFWKEFSAHVRGEHPEAILVGENWTKTPLIAPYYGSAAAGPEGDELPMSFNFPLAEEIVKGVQDGNANGLAEKLAEMARLYPPGVIDTPFLTNHDQIRAATVLKNDARKLRSAAAVLLTLPGAPFVYYGEELGMQNGPSGDDEWKRTPMPWDGSETGGFTTGKPWYRLGPGTATANVAAEKDEPGSLLQRYRSLIHVRKASPALRTGSIELLTKPSMFGAPVLAFIRQAKGDRVLVAHNLGSNTAPVPFKGAAGEALFADPGATPTSLPAGATGIWRLP